jgi:hypothetical protein
MLDLINADRAAERLPPVEWEPFAAQVGQTHAEEMAAHGYMSHWNLDGEGPDVRYGRAGGTETVQENVYQFWRRYTDGTPVPVSDWEQVVIDAQVALMESPGHRANIMDPMHTHVGVGIAYNPQTGEVGLAQEFINRYVRMDPLPGTAQVGEQVMVAGELLGDAQNPLINLAYEPFPSPMTVEQLNATATYVSPAEFVSAVEPAVDGAGRFSAQLTLDAEGWPGIYHIRIWIERADTSVQAVNAVIDVME